MFVFFEYRYSKNIYLIICYFGYKYGIDSHFIFIEIFTDQRKKTETIMRFYKSIYNGEFNERAE